MDSDGSGLPIGDGALLQIHGIHARSGNTMTRSQAIDSIIRDLQNGYADIQYDNQGQMIVYSNLFLQVDGSMEEYEDHDYQG